MNPANPPNESRQRIQQNAINEANQLSELQGHLSRQNLNTPIRQRQPPQSSAIHSVHSTPRRTARSNQVDPRQVRSHSGHSSQYSSAYSTPSRSRINSLSYSNTHHTPIRSASNQLNSHYSPMIGGGALMGSMDQQQYAAYIQQRALQQQRYTAYVQQHQYKYYQQIGQQYGYQAMVNAMQRNPTMTQYVQYLNRSQRMNAMNSARNRTGNVMLSAEDQPLLRSADKEKRKRRRKRKRVETEDGDTHYVTRSETVSLDLSDQEESGLDKNGYDKYTLINQNEYLPDIDGEFDEWLYFSKKIWKRQRKYKEKGSLEDAILADDISTSLDSPETSPRGLKFKSVFLKGMWYWNSMLK